MSADDAARIAELEQRVDELEDRLASMTRAILFAGKAAGVDLGLEKGHGMTFSDRPHLEVVR